MTAVEDHIREQHSDLLQKTSNNPELFIKKIALRSKDNSDQTYFCSICSWLISNRKVIFT